MLLYCLLIAEKLKTIYLYLKANDINLVNKCESKINQESCMYTNFGSSILNRSAVFKKEKNIFPVKSIEHNFNLFSSFLLHLNHSSL